MRTFISICLLTLTLEAFSQKMEFESYGLVPSYAKGRVIPCNSKLTIEKFGSSKYKIIAIDPSTHETFFNATVSFFKYYSFAKSYNYNGTVIFEDTDKFNCTIETNITKLSEFINDGKCNPSIFAFEIEYKITLYYWGIGSSEWSQKAISFYPVCNE